MAQFTLPKNSKMSEGKVWPVPAGGHRTTAFRIYRWNPDDGQNPRIDTYHVDRGDCGIVAAVFALLWTRACQPIVVDHALSVLRCRVGPGSVRLWYSASSFSRLRPSPSSR